MRKVLKCICFGLIVIGLGIQLVPVDRTNPPIVQDFEGPLAVKEILQRSCYDCHSNETRWPWYSYVAPVSWLLAHDVEEGREELNFSDWARYSKDTHKLEEIAEEVEEGEMPMPIFLVMHSEAKVSESELSLLKQHFNTK